MPSRSLSCFRLVAITGLFLAAIATLGTSFAWACPQAASEAFEGEPVEVVEATTDDPSFLAQCRRGAALNALGRHADAAEAFAAAALDAEDDTEEAGALREQGRALLFATSPDSALQTLQRSLVLAQAGSDEATILATMNAMVALHLTTGAIDRAIQRAQEGIEVALRAEAEGRDRFDEELARFYFNEAAGLVRLEDYEAATNALQSGLARAETLDSPIIATNYLVLLGYALGEQGRATEAMAFYERAIDRLTDLPPGAHRFNALYNAAVTSDRAGDTGRTLQIAERYRTELQVGEASKEYVTRGEVLILGAEASAAGVKGGLARLADVLVSYESEARQAYLERAAEMEETFDAERRQAEIEALTEREALARRSLQRQRVALSVIFVLTAAFVIAVGFFLQRRRRAARAEAEAVALRATLTERSRLSREVHDTLMQSYVATTMQAQRALKLLDRDPDRAKNVLETALADSNTAMGEARQAILGPGEPSSDLSEALHQLKDRTERMGCTVRSGIEDTLPRLSPALSLAAIRIASEAVANARQHAECEQITIAVRTEADRLVVTVTDDGKGFDLEAPCSSGHAGLRVMDSRAREANGTLRIDSRLGQGTIVEARLPIEGERPQKVHSGASAT